MGFQYRTKNGYNMFDLSSMLQKAIRRNEYSRAGWAARELYYSYPNYLWKRLLVISAEDCFGALTEEILALRVADETVNKGKPKDSGHDLIFISKAIIMLCRALKNRDACYFACNFMTINAKIDPDTIEHVDISECKLDEEGIPDYVYDKHTIRGKKMGRTSLDMIEKEEKDLEPHQMSLFDDGDWAQWRDAAEAKGTLAVKDQIRYPEFAKDKKHYN